MVIIEGVWGFLRLMQESDAQDIVNWRNREDVARWLVQWEPLTVEAHLAWFKKSQEQGDLSFIYTDAKTEQPLGSGALYNIDREERSAEWGRVCFKEGMNPFGILEASFLIHCLAFELLDMKRLFCACAQANESAVRLNTFLGYQEIGICPLALKTPHGSYNLIDFEMLPEHFAKQKEDIEQSLYKGRSIPQFLTAHDDLKDSLILK